MPRFILLLVLALAAGSGSVAGATQRTADWTDIQGRWREDVRPNGPNRMLEIGLLEIAPCDVSSLCGRRIHPDGTCGEIVLRLRQDWAGEVQGALAIDGRTMAASAHREDGKLAIRAVRASLFRRALPFASTFRREGLARCAEGVS